MKTDSTLTVAPFKALRKVLTHGARYRRKMEGLQPPARLETVNLIDSHKDNKNPAVYNGQAGGPPAWEECT